MKYITAEKKRRLAQVVITLFISILLWGCLSGEQSPDSVVEDYIVAYVKRSVQLNNNDEIIQPDFRRLATFNVGGDLYIKDRASPSADERNVTFAVTGGMGDVKDVEISYDGSKVLFALRLPEIEDADDDEQPTWNIWEYDVGSQSLRRLINSDIIAEEGQDISPYYLPDGRIIFSSTRQRLSKAILLDEGKPQFAGLEESRQEEAFLLHVMSADGSTIEQVTFNQSHDFDPVVLANGRVMFTRWNNVANRSQFDLYDMNPDGTDSKLVYGANSHDTGSGDEEVQFHHIREAEDGSVVAVLMPFEDTMGGGDIVSLDVENFGDHDQVLLSGSGSIGQASLTRGEVSSGEEITTGGRFSSAFPFWDDTGRMLVSWTPCRLIENDETVACTDERLADSEHVEAGPLYGVYLYDASSNTQLPIVLPEEDVIISDVVAAQPRTLPTTIFDKAIGAGLDTDLFDEGVGLLHIRSVYDFDGVYNGLGGTATSLTLLADPMETTAEQRPARFLRLIKSVAIPDEDVRDIDNTAFGASNQNLMREILGYTMIEPDGSVMVKVPANVPFAIEVLDAQGQRIGSRHLGWLQIRAGEEKHCNGCHINADGIPHGGPIVVNSINSGAAVSGIPFPNTTNVLLPDQGETMAQTRARISCETDCAAITPSMDLKFTDEWTDEAQRAKDADVNLLYADLDTTAPASGSCINDWSASCRSVINYITHIHPLWGKERIVYDVDEVTVLRDDTCTSCHSNVDQVMNAMVPAAQLDLTDGPSDQEADHYKSYRELLFADDEQEVIDNILVDRQIQARGNDGELLFETDEEGELILDGDNQPIPIMIPVDARGPSMSVAGSANSYFFDFFTAGENPDADAHVGRLTPAELRLLSEWLDLGGQYFNNPFDAPAN